MATKQEVQNRRNWMREQLLTKKFFSIEDYMERFSVKKRTVQEDLKSLSDAGILYRRKKDQIIFEGETRQDACYAASSDVACARRFYLMMQVCQHQNCRGDRLIKDYFERYEEEEQGAAITERTLRNDLQRLVEEGILKREPYYDNEKKIKTYEYRLGENQSVFREYDFDTLFEMKDQLDIHAKDSIYGEILNSVLKKLDIVLGLEAEEEKEEIVHSYWSHHQLLQDVDELLYPFSKIDFKHKKIALKYQQANGKVEQITFAVGMIVYASEQDNVYLIGKNERNLQILQVKKMLDCQETEETHQEYTPECQKVYQQIFREMFIVSVEEPKEVRVRFKDVFQVKEKVQKLCDSRNQYGLELAKIEQKGDYFYYTDTIRGLNDFARYLRSFGYACTVEKPEKLRQSMIRTSQKLVERYREIGVEKE